MDRITKQLTKTLSPNVKREYSKFLKIEEQKYDTQFNMHNTTMEETEEEAQDREGKIDEAVEAKYHTHGRR